jgi:hypothetical protein
MSSTLERFDDPEHWERPSDFDWASESRAFAAFVADLQTKLRRQFEVETGSRVQDASFHSQISLPGGLLRFSNFGRMMAFAPDSEVPEDVLAAVRELAATHRYLLVPSAELEKPYPPGDGTRFGIGAWWIRYFDYL